jgi:predicted metal-dependent phosphoesterase TrpH
MEFKADLHCHSTCSDGTFSPEQLVKHALEIGLKGLSITDHDTIEAYRTILPIAQELGLAMITGIEFSAMFKGVSVHILGYAFKWDDPDLLALCQKHKRRREERNAKMLHRLAKLGMPIEDKDICEAFSTSHTLGRPHIAQAMINKGYVRTIPEAFKKYLGDGKSAFVQGESYSVEETIQAIHRAKGAAVIAHPHLIESKTTLRALLDMNFD